jgi:hypothetical protein
MVEELELRGMVVDVSALREGDEDGKASDGVADFEFEVGVERVARDIKREPNAATLDLLWHTGELRFVALSTLHLEALGVPAVGLNVHETGLRAWPKDGVRRNFHALSRNLRECGSPKLWPTLKSMT